MNKDDIYNSFETRDFVNICEGMTWREIDNYTLELIISIEKLNLGENGFYHDKVHRIKRLYRFLKGLRHYMYYKSAPSGFDDVDFSYMQIILDHANGDSF